MQTDPVVVVGDHAVADWIQGSVVVVLCSARPREVEIVVCAGEGLTHAETLEQAGVPPDAAKVMAQRLSQAEESLPEPRMIQRLASMPDIQITRTNIIRTKH